MPDSLERSFVELVLDHAGQLVLLVRDDGVLAELAQRHVRQHGSRSDPLHGIAG